MERVKGIEPSYSAWKAAALPLSYTRPMRLGPRAFAIAPLRSVNGQLPAVFSKTRPDARIEAMTRGSARP